MAKGRMAEWETEENLERITTWARRGLTDEEIFANIGVSRPTFYDWLKKSPNILNALKKGREVSIQLVENALFKIACGYYVEESFIDDKGRETTKIKHIPPNLGAQVFILKNRKPKYWKDKIITDDDEKAIARAEDVLVAIKKVAGLND